MDKNKGSLNIEKKGIFFSQNIYFSSKNQSLLKKNLFSSFWYEKILFSKGICLCFGGASLFRLQPLVKLFVVALSSLLLPCPFCLKKKSYLDSLCIGGSKKASTEDKDNNMGNFLYSFPRHLNTDILYDIPPSCGAAR